MRDLALVCLLLVAADASAAPKAPPKKIDDSWIPADVAAHWKDPDRGHNTQGALYQGGTLEATLFRGAESDRAKAGARIAGLGPDRRAADVTVVSVTAKAITPGAPPVQLYELRDAAGKNPCAGRTLAGNTDAALAGKAIAVAGAWGKGGARVASSAKSPFFTFSCLDGAVGKCVAWGYRADIDPAKTDLHAACVRMARADYCGTGRPFTCDGTDIDIVDRAGIQKRAADTKGEQLEADWTKDGAACLGFARMPGCAPAQKALKALIAAHCKDAGHPIRLDGCDATCKPGDPTCGALRTFATPGKGKVCQRAVDACGAK